MKKRILKWTVGILLAPIVLFFILAALLYVPAIQDFAVRKATAYAAEATGMDVRIGLLRLTFLFDINLQEVQVTDKEEDTLLDVEQLTVDLSFSSIFRGEIDVEGIELTQASVNTKSLIKSVAIRGHIGHFYVDSHGIKLPQESSWKRRGAEALCRSAPALRVWRLPRCVPPATSTPRAGG